MASVFIATCYVLILSIFLRLATLAANKLDERLIFSKKFQLKSFEIILLLLISLFFLFAHFAYINLPIQSGPDEPVHVARQLWQFEQYRSASTYSRVFLLTIFILLCLLLSIIGIPSATTSFIRRNREKISLKLLVFSVVILAIYILFFLFQQVLEELPKYLGSERRWPPLGTILASISFWIFGKNEFAARLPSSLFYLGTGYYVYRILRGKQIEHWKRGICGVLVCFSCPVFFFYGHLDYRDVGGAFFLCLGMYYLLRYLQEQRHQHLFIVTFATLAGYLERRPVLIMVFAAIFFVLLFYLKNKRFGEDRERVWNSIILWISLCVVLACAILPWMIITEDIRPYHFYVNNFLDFKLLIAYIELLPSIFSWPIILIFVLGGVISIYQRSLVGVVAFSYLVLLYVLFTGDLAPWIPVYRFTVLFVPFIAILTAHVINLFDRDTFQVLCLSTIGVLSLTSLWIWNGTSDTYGFYPPKTLRLADISRNYPFDELIQSLDFHNIPKGDIIYPAWWQTSFRVYYTFFYGQKGGYRERLPPHNNKMSMQRNTTILDVKEFCHKKSCTAIILPLRRDERGNVRVKWLPDVLFKDIEENRLDDFHVQAIYLKKYSGLTLLRPKNNGN